jgi:serine/threonine-protein kinase
VALPARIGRYRILGLLGRGAMGVVYRGRDDGLDRDVAVKVMAGAEASAEGHDRFLREARSVARLQHPNIVTIYELGDHQGAPFMAMELLEGLDLQRAIASGRRPHPQVALRVVLQVLAGLGHAHEHGIVHRDVKPSNVFLPRRRPAKITDFGVARLAGGTTAAGVVVGTPNYMSPEQVRTGLVDGRSDLFSVGLILYEVLTGEKVYRADNVVSLLYKIAHEEPALAGLPAGAEWERLRKVIARSLAREPDERYPDARAMAADLGQALVDLGGTPHGALTAEHGLVVDAPAEPTVAAPVPPPAPVRAPVEASRRLAWAVLAVATVALLGGLGLYIHLRPEPGPEPDAAPSPAAPRPAPLRETTAPQPAPATSAPALSAPVAAPSAPTTSAPAALPTPEPLASSPMPVASPRRPSPGTEAAEPAPRPGGDAAQLERANELFDRGRYAAALAEARPVLRRNPGNAEARTLVEDAEAAIVVEDRIKKAREALRKGDKEKALQEVRAGLAVAPSDGRLLELFKEATR